MDDKQDTESEYDSIIDEAQAEHEQYIEEMKAKHGCVPPGTFEKELGHEIILNPDAEVCPSHCDDETIDLRGSVRNHVDLAVFIPRKSGVCWNFQTDGMLMKHPAMEGTLVPLNPYNFNPGRFPRANYLQDDNGDEMRQIWSDCEDALRVSFKDEPAPAGYAQSQEGLRWVSIEEHTVKRDIGFDMEPYFPPYVDWVRWEQEHDHPIAIVYPNCD